MPTINIELDEATANFTWSVDGLNGLEAMGLTVDVLMDMHGQYLADLMRPQLNCPDARVCIEMASDTLSMSYRPETADPKVIVGMLAGVLIGFVEKAKEPGFDPYEAVLGALVFQQAGEGR